MSKILSGRTTVVSAGTAVALGSQIVNSIIIIKADPANTGKLFVGNTGANTVSSGTGFALSAGDSLSYYAGNLNEVYVNSDTNAQRVEWFVTNLQ